jgi:hypothetical protein
MQHGEISLAWQVRHQRKHFINSNALGREGERRAARIY